MWCVIYHMLGVTLVSSHKGGVLKEARSEQFMSPFIKSFRLEALKILSYLAIPSINSPGIIARHRNLHLLVYIMAESDVSRYSNKVYLINITHILIVPCSMQLLMHMQLLFSL